MRPPNSPLSASLLLFGLTLSAASVGLGWYFLKSGREVVRTLSPEKLPGARYNVTIGSGVLFGIAADILLDTISSGIIWLVAVIFSLLLERQIRRWMKPKELTSTAT